MASPLLTELDQQKFVLGALGSKFVHHGSVFEPTSYFYKKKLDNKDLQQIYHALCSWLGIPRSTITVRFQTSSSTTKHDLHALLLKPSLQAHTAVCAALISRRLALVLLTRKNTSESTPNLASLIDTFTIEYGLGLVMVNGLGEDRLPLNLFGELGQTQLAKKGYLSGRSYAKRFVDYAHRFQLDIAAWGGFLTPKGRKLIPRVLRHPARKVARRPAEVKSLDKSQTLMRINTVVLSALCAVMVGVGLYVSSFRPRYLPPELSLQREKIDQLRNLYQLCSGAVLEKQAGTDQSNIFIARSTEADQNRCVSLRNKYNYEVDKYNQAIKNIKD